ncbi:hypothetical protein PV963_25010 [Streptomyces coeruleorubidus]|uniref:hypothetical protein n=1 Tax=Streptomyces coeruleorubidus TaxID=116188 RepID=UPI00237F1201|nr:hypothetical protein [Streptomyces coeruleorubidus]WDV53389.1 hypothetical protein PV963_25010 [Streptomyces coeruleorubidus]
MSLIVELRRAWPSRAVIALLDDPGTDAYRSALRSGAAGVVAHDAEMTEIGEVVNAALEDHVRLPAATARALAARTTASASAEPAPRATGRVRC